MDADMRRRGLDGYLAALAFWVALEVAETDPADEIADQIVKEYGEDAVLRGLAVVCTRLRGELTHHAEEIGCGCGTDEWLERFRFEAVKEFG